MKKIDYKINLQFKYKYIIDIMNPKIDLKSDVNDVLMFTLSGVNVSLANAIRRTILSDIQQIVFKTQILLQENIFLPLHSIL